jgi:glutathione S-transferase
MELWHSPTSPYVRKVCVLIAEAGIAGVRLVPSATKPLAPDPGVVAQNPLGKVPALRTETGAVLYDSRVICRYLDARAGAGLYPEGEALWPVLTREALADGIMDAAILMVYEGLQRPEELRSPAWVEAQWTKIARALDAAEGEGVPAGGAPDIGQIALGCALGYLDLRHGARDWRAGRPRLAAWEAVFAARPSMQATRPPA